MPLDIQRNLIFIMCRTLKPKKLTAGKMITLSLYTSGKVSAKNFYINTLLLIYCLNYLINLLQIMKTCVSIFALFSYIAANKHLK